jgi:hypothetical protein
LVRSNKISNSRSRENIKPTYRDAALGELTDALRTPDYIEKRVAER